MKLRNKQTGEVAEIPDDLSALWDIVQKYMPDYKNRELILKNKNFQS